MDLEILMTALRAAGFSEDDAEWQRAIDAANEAEGAEGTVTDETPESREVETANEAAADAVDETAAARASQVATEVDAGELRSLFDESQREIATLNERIGDLDGFRANFEARYGVLTSDEDEANARAGESEVDAPLASEEEFTEASNYELSVNLFRNVIMPGWAARYGDAPVPDGAVPTARALSYVRRVQGTVLSGEAPSFR